MQLSKKHPYRIQTYTKQMYSHQSKHTLIFRTSEANTLISSSVNLISYYHSHWPLLPSSVGYRQSSFRQCSLVEPIANDDQIAHSNFQRTALCAQTLSFPWYYAERASSPSVSRQGARSPWLACIHVALPSILTAELVVRRIWYGTRTCVSGPSPRSSPLVSNHAAVQSPEEE